MKTPSAMPDFSARPQDLPKKLYLDYLEFAKSTYQLTSRQAFWQLAAQLVVPMENKFAAMNSKQFETDSKIDFLQKTLLPAAGEAINNIVSARSPSLVNKAGLLKLEAEKYIKSALIVYKLNNADSEVKTMKRAKECFNALGDVLANINDPKTPEISAVNGKNDCGYWCRILWLFQVDFDDLEKKLNSQDDAVNVNLAKANTAISAIFDIDDSVNKDKSYRSTHKQEIANSEFQEEQRLKKIEQSKTFYDGLISIADKSPIKTLLIAVLNNLFAAGNLYTSLPEKNQRVPQNDNILLKMRRLMDSFVNNVSEGKFSDIKNITESDITAIVSFSGGKITKADVDLAIAGATPKPIDNLSTDTSRTIMQARTMSAMSSGTTEAQARLNKEAADKIAKEKQDTLDAQHAAADLASTEEHKEDIKHDIAATSKDAVDGKVDAKDSAELADKTTTITTDSKGGSGTDLAIGSKDMEILEKYGDKASEKVESLMDKKIAGVPVPYVIGGAALTIGLIAIARK